MIIYYIYYMFQGFAGLRLLRIDNSAMVVWIGIGYCTDSAGYIYMWFGYLSPISLMPYR